MVYRTINDSRVSLLGFGCMRFPTNPDGTINEADALLMLDKAIKHGVNYLDTAYPYHNSESEPFVGRAIKKYDRSSLFIATKMPMWAVKTLDDAKKILADQFKRLDTDYIDFYLLHALNKGKWNDAKSLGVLDYLIEQQKQGKIKQLGFSFHDSYPVFEEILTYRKWDFCQIQYNYMDVDDQAGQKGYELCEKLGVSVVVMEPVKGGSLAVLPEKEKAILDSVCADKSCASWALRWVASRKNVSCVLSGMSDMEQLDDNLESLGNFTALDEKSEAAIAQVRSALRGRAVNGCTGCRYCMPCPNGVDIPMVFRNLNHCAVFGGAPSSEVKESAAKCIACGLCEAACPQKISIISDLQRAEDFIRI